MTMSFRTSFMAACVFDVSLAPVQEHVRGARSDVPELVRPCEIPPARSDPVDVHQLLGREEARRRVRLLQGLPWPATGGGDGHGLPMTDAVSTKRCRRCGQHGRRR